MKKALLGVAIVGVGFLVLGNVTATRPFGPHFTAGDLQTIKDNIKKQYGKREGIEVLDVQIIQESATKATVFVKLRNSILGEFMHSCTATMGQDWKYIWKCTLGLG
jgi:hypothetical protein